ncbi:MAG TPA: DUF4214 domain-containing protein [Iamia sp.]
MVPGEGLLELRDAEDPFALESPTTVSGTVDDDTGAITGTTFVTPTVEFDLPVLDGALTANVEATITEVSPGTSTGSVTRVVDSEPPLADVSLQTSVTVDLHIVVQGAGIDAMCQSTPVNLDLASVEPTDGEGVVLRDPDFFIPPLPITETCDETVTTNANPMLSGTGHSVTLPLDGTIPIPEAGTEDSTTDLVVTPPGGAAIGEEVTMTATVASATEATDPATGFVDFFDGDDKIGEASVIANVATFTTTTLGLGDHTLTAKYRGDSLYRSSVSDETAYEISASPVFEVTVPGSVRIGDPPVPFPLVLENPSVGTDVNNARIDVTLKRYTPGGASSDALDPADVLLEREGPTGVWTPVTLTAVTPVDAPTLTGTIGAATGQPLAAGASLTESLRISFPTGTPATIPGPLTVTFDAIQVDPTDGTPGETLTSTSGQLVMRNATRAATITSINDSAPPFVRYGGTLIADVTTIPVSGINTANYHAQGPVRLLVDGVQVPFWSPVLGGEAEPVLEVPYGPDGFTVNTYVTLPPTIGVGPHTLTAVFAGDSLFAGSSASRPFTVHDPIGTPYECLFNDPFFPQKFVVHASAEGRLPATLAAGSTAPVEDFDLSFKGGRSFSEYFSTTVVLSIATLQNITIDLGEDGEGSATGATQTGDPWAGPPETTPLDYDLAFDGEEAAVTVAGTPGAVITPSIEGFAINSDFFGTPISLTCVAVGDPIDFGEIVVAGTTLTVESPTPTRSDDQVTLRAAVSPDAAAGVVDFYDGTDLIGIAAIDDGEATIRTTLDEGSHSLTAKSRTGASAPSTTSAAVVLAVLPAADCGAFAEAGNGAAVRLVYMELLRRCPDQAGYDYWKGQLDEGNVTRAQFARRISDSFEARGVIVDDAYQLMLGRDADAGGRAFWAGRLATNAGYDDLLAELAASPEFNTLAGGTRSGFVTRVYERLLDRSPEPSALEFWTDYMVARGRRQLVLALFDLPEPQAAIVISAYEEILSREPSTTEKNDGSELFGEDKDRSALYASLIAKSEFFDRAQDFPNPED